MLNLDFQKIDVFLGQDIYIHAKKNTILNSKFYDLMSVSAGSQRGAVYMLSELTKVSLISIECRAL